MKNFNKQILNVLILSWVWFMFSSANIFPSLLFPPPQKILQDLFKIFIEDGIIYDIYLTVGRMIGGLIIGVIIGMLLGTIIGFSSLRKQAEFWIDFLRSIPGAALFPVFMLLFGLRETAKVSLVVFATALIVIINTVYGIKNINNTRLMVAKILKLSKIQTFFNITLPESL